MKSEGLGWALLSIILLLNLSVSTDSLPKQLEILSSPIITQSQTLENISICFADCDSCQNTGQCEVCWTPWYIRTESGCELTSSNYVLESTEEERRWQNFIASSEWMFNGETVASRICQPSQQVLTNSFVAIGPFGSGSVTYQRTISAHSYYGFKMMLILSNWTSTSSLTIKVTNENNITISNQVLNLQTASIRNSYLEQLCSSGATDRRASLTLEVNEVESTQVLITFEGSMADGASWSLSSFVLVSGNCNQSCASCSGYSSAIENCRICNNFLANNETHTCSSCLTGFRLILAESRCQKCSIEFLTCEPPTCNYPQISLASPNCSLTENYTQEIFLSEETFFGSLFTIQSQGSVVTQCGDYSVIGPAPFGEVISRSFVTLPGHIAISINLNIFIFDQIESTQRYSLVILIDGVQAVFSQTDQIMNITGTSNECDFGNGVRYEAMKTFTTNVFVPHKKRDGVVIGVSLGSGTGAARGWGLRDVRLLFRKCDARCGICGENGCERCVGFFQLNELECKNCLPGTGLSTTNSSCQPCPLNCLNCTHTATATNCSQCSSGFYLFSSSENSLPTCQKNPNLGNSSMIRVNTNGGCSVTIPPNETLIFDIVENRGKVVFNFIGESVKKIVRFYLVKIDDWEGDHLDIYLNDLLIERLTLGGTGNLYCGEADQNDEITYHSYEIEDSNQTLTVEFEAVQSNSTLNRRFGISRLEAYPIGCKECSSYDFLYKIKYNYDESLFVEMAFNMIYENKDPEDFKNIFRIKDGDKELKYEITANDSIRYWLKSEDIESGEILNSNISVECKYPLRVTAQIPYNGTYEGFAQANEKEFFGPGRVLQESSDAYQRRKSLDNSNSEVFVDRFAPLRNREESVQGLQTFFSILTRIVVYLGFISFFFACQTPCTHVMHNFQKLWVHIYVASLALSPIFKTVLWGFRESEDQNIAIRPEQWESGLPKYLYYDTPAQYQHYYKDITFFRHIYNVGLAFAILIVVYVVFHFVFRLKRFENPEHTFIRHMRNTFVHRPLFYFNSVIFYQYFTVVISCCLQFLDLRTRTNETTFAGVNAAACIIAFILATLYPIVLHLLLNRKRKSVLDLLTTIMSNNRNKEFENYITDLSDLEEEQVIYNNKYSEIFFRFLPKQLWNQNISDSEMISERHLFYNLFRYGDLWWHAIVVILLHYSPFAQAFLLVLTNGFHLAINAFANLNTTRFYRIAKSLELLCFIVIEIMIIVMLSLLETLRFESYETLGIVSVIFVLFILLITFVRFFYTAWRLWKEYRRSPSEADVREVIRHDRGYERGWNQN